MSDTTTPAEKIDLVPVTSSALAAVGYNADKRILAVQFPSGDIHHLADVSAVSVAHFLHAESLGRHWTQHIKGKYQSQKMTGSCPNCGAKRGWIGETCSDCGTAAYAASPKAGE